MAKARSIILATITVAMALSARAYAQGRFDVTRKAVTAEDLRKELGLDIYSFVLAVPDGEPFSFAVLTVSPDGKEVVRPLFKPFTSLPGESPSVRLALKSTSSRLGLALLSDDSELSINVSLTGCNGNGFATIIPNPTAGLPGTQKTVAPVFRNRGGRIHLLDVLKKAPNGKQELSAAIIVLRAETK